MAGSGHPCTAQSNLRGREGVGRTGEGKGGIATPVSVLHQSVPAAGHCRLVESFACPHDSGMVRPCPRVQNRDSLGSKGTLGAGELQWLTAGSGILHQEMPEDDARGRMHGLQLWANLPSSSKMMAPRTRISRQQRYPRPSRTMARACASCAGSLGAACADRGCRRRSFLPRHLGPAATPQDFARRDRTACLRLCVRRIGFASLASQPFSVLTAKEIEGAEIVIRESTGNRSLVEFDSGE